MISRIPLVWLTFGLLSYGPIAANPVQAVPLPTPAAKTSNIPPAVVMNQFYNYLHQYKLWLGDDRGACSYEVDPTGIKKDGADRFFLAKISRGRTGTACRGVLNFQIMQVNCQTNTLYQFVREQSEDMRIAGWERHEITLSDPTARPDGTKNQSAAAVKAICAL
jgi:hypothetical protein